MALKSKLVINEELRLKYQQDVRDLCTRHGIDCSEVYVNAMWGIGPDKVGLINIVAYPEDDPRHVNGGLSVGCTNNYVGFKFGPLGNVYTLLGTLSGNGASYYWNWHNACSPFE